MADPDAAPAPVPAVAPAVAPPAAPADSLGVVDPIRIPVADAFRRFWTALPTLGRAFLVLALVDVAIRVLGIAGLPSPIDLAQPLSLLGFLPHLAYVLFPVAVLWRRPDAAAETPLILWGAVALALVELLSLPLTSLFPAGGGDITPWVLLQVVAVAGRGGGYLALAVGLTALTRSAPSPTLLGLSNLVLWVIGGSAAISMVLVFFLPGPELGDPAWNTQVQLVNAIGPLPTLAFAYLARVIVRGTVDLRRPTVATYVGTGAVVVAAIPHLLTLAVGAIVVVQSAFALSSGTLGEGSALAFGLLGTAADLLLVVAFGLGLADTSVRIGSASEPKESQA